MRYCRLHANALAQRRIRVVGLADVHCVGTHLDSQRDLSDHVARVGADHATAQDLLSQREAKGIHGGFVCKAIRWVHLSDTTRFTGHP